MTDLYTDSLPRGVEKGRRNGRWTGKKGKLTVMRS